MIRERRMRTFVGRRWHRLVEVAAVALHVLGVGLVIRLTAEPLWALALPVAFAVPVAARLMAGRSRSATAVRLSAARGSVPPELNAASPGRPGSPRPLWRAALPLVLAYGVALGRVAISLVARDGGRAVPEPWGAWLDLNLAMAVGLGWTLVVQTRARRDLGRVLGAATLVWALVAYVAKRTHGVTGSDPFAYVLMAVDLATHGTPLHVFPLTSEMNTLGVSLWPIVPVGYGLPDPQTFAANSVWPPGYSVVLALAYRLVGEPALYWTTPLLGIATLAATWWLTTEILATADPWHARAAAGFTVLILATSFQQVDHLLVPLADIPAQLFTVLAVAAALRAARDSSHLLSLASGLCLGVAFTMRYTQALVALPILFIWARRRPRKAMTGLVWTGLAAWIPVAPLFAYHAAALGSPVAVESSELQLFSAANIADSLAGTLTDLLQPNEFLLIVPFGVLGSIELWRRRRGEFVVLAAWVVVIMGFHLPYAALRTRDMLSMFPVLALLTGVGMALVLRVLQARRVMHRALLSALLIGVPLWLRSAPTIEALGAGASYTGFGYLQAAQRQAFASLMELTPDNAVIAATLNNGPVMLYSQRDSVRAGAWTRGEWLRVVDATLTRDRRIFVINDGEDMARPLADLTDGYRLERRGQIQVPYFSADAGSEDRAISLIEILRLEEGAASPS